MTDAAPIIGIIMGSRSDWETMREASATLTALHIPHECKVVSAHRTPDRLYDYAKTAAGRGLKCIIAGAGGAAHLPGMAASTRLTWLLGSAPKAVAAPENSFDWVMISPAVYPDVDKENSYIADPEIWNDASDHRAVVVTLKK